MILSLDDTLPRLTNKEMQQDRVLVAHDRYHPYHDHEQHLDGEDETALKTLARAAAHVLERSLQSREIWEQLTHHDREASSASHERVSEWAGSIQPDKRPLRIRKLQDEERDTTMEEIREGVWLLD